MSKNIPARSYADSQVLREMFKQVAEPAHPDGIMLADFWRKREAAGGFVVCRDVPSRPLACVLHNLLLLEPVGAPGHLSDLRVKLAGDTLHQRLGGNTAGMLLSELFSPRDFESHIARAADVLDRNAPYFMRCELRRASFVERQLEIIVLPVWNASRSARWILAGVFYFNPRQQR